MFRVLAIPRVATAAARRAAMPPGHPVSVVNFRPFSVNPGEPPVLGVEVPMTPEIQKKVDTTEAKMPDFDHVAHAFSSKTTAELVRAYGVFTLCGIKPIVQNSGKLMGMGFSVLGDKAMSYILKKTFFGHFCAGETADDIQPVLHRLEASGVGYILDYAAEADVSEEKVAVHMDREGVVSARIFDYENEKKCDANAAVIMQCIEAASRNKNGFAAVKLTALGNVELLEHISRVLHAVRRMFRTVSQTAPDELRQWDFYMTRVLTKEVFTTSLGRLGVQLTPAQIEDFFQKVDQDQNGFIDYLEWTQFLTPTNQVEFRAFFELGSDAKANPMVKLPQLDKEQVMQLQSMIARTQRICEYAAKNKVRLMIDAEQTYFQPAIDHMTNIMMDRHNRGEFPVIYNTYQCYLNDSFSRMRLDMERSRRLGYKFAAKIVRGAYMFQEKKRAAEYGYKNPIMPNLAATHDNYHFVLASILDEVAERGANVMVATHNEKSVKMCIQGMQDKGIAKDGGVYFGQLLGMCDHVSFTLGFLGYGVYKYVPYGPIREVMPYLIRRAEENSDLMGGVGKEMKLLGGEIKRRLVGGKA